uniref:Uncharacterized protein n=1 Tax=Moumouvirus sp. 'Monve' TaxID=1128131 RepID=H2EEK7_9VIRU|nr:hypothetical protein mv_L625 [Moumouvirus Monve]
MDWASVELNPNPRYARGMDNV